MKQYQITFNVPDDFIPESLSLTAAYGEEENTISIADEGFTDENREITISEETKAFIRAKTAIVVDEIPDNAVVRVMFSSLEGCSPEQLHDFMKCCEIVYGRPCICCNSNMDVFVENADESVKMLNGMIAKIKTRAAVKDTSGIILPK